MFKKAMMTLAASVLLSTSAFASTDLLTDGNLDLSPTYNSWDIGGGTYSWKTNPALVTDPTDYYVVLQATGGMDTYMTQTFSTVAGTLYTVTFDYISTKGGTQYGIQDGTASGTFIDYQTLDKSADKTAWTTASYTFTALSGQSTIGFVSSVGAGKLYLNNVSVTAAAVPEPASFALFLAGLGGLGVVSRRRRVK